MKRTKLWIIIPFSILAAILLVFFFPNIQEMYWTARCKNKYDCLMEQEYLHYTYEDGDSSNFEEYWFKGDNHLAYLDFSSRDVYFLTINGEIYRKENNGDWKERKIQEVYRNMLPYQWEYYFAYSGIDLTNWQTNVHFLYDTLIDGTANMQTREIVFCFDIFGSLVQINEKWTTYAGFTADPDRIRSIDTGTSTFHNTDLQVIESKLEEAYAEAKAATG